MIVELSDLKSYLGICDDSQDRLLGLLLESANNTVLSYIGRDIIASDHEEIINGNGQKEITARHYPINSITEVAYNRGTYDVEEREALEPSQYTYKGKTGQIYLRSNMYRGFQNYRIQYNAGYEKIPADLKIAVLKIAAGYYTTKNSDGVKGETVNGDRIDFDVSSIPDNVLTILSTYRDT